MSAVEEKEPMCYTGIEAGRSTKTDGEALFMNDTNITLAMMTEGWQMYQRESNKALAPLSNEQLVLRAAPNLHSIGELARSF
jgi:hypothetical protein